MWLRNTLIVGTALALGVLLAWLDEKDAALWWLGSWLALLGAWHLMHLARLEHWLALPSKREVPTGHGSWQPIFDALSRFARHEAQSRQEREIELARIHAAVHRLPDALVVLDRYDHVVWANRAAEALHGIWGTHRPIHHFLRQPEFLAYLQQPAPGEALPIGLASHPGRSFEIRIVDTVDDQRLMVTRDVSEQQRLDAMRRDFVANVSHEIRTPLTVVGGFVETLLDLDLPEDTRREYLGTILQQTATMRQLVEDLLTLATLEHGDARPAQEEEIDMDALLPALVSDARVISADRHRIELDVHGPTRVRAQPAALQSAIRNLLTNAIRYTPEGGRIQVRWSMGADGRPRLAVQDDGIGIPAEHIPRLTERFYRVDRGRSRGTGGTGLGLAIVKHALQRHQAQLLVDSEPGKGSTFTIVLPAARLVAGQTQAA